MFRPRSIASGVLISGAMLGVFMLGAPGQIVGQGSSAPAQEGAAGAGDELARLKAEVARLKTATVAAAAMHEVDYHAQNLWFAGKNGNWPLADFYWKKILVHMRLALGEDLDTARGDAKRKGADVLSAIESAKNMQVGSAIERKDVVGFQSTYRALLEGCYNCHKAEGMPYLRPRMPMPPAQSIINVDPRATWPR